MEQTKRCMIGVPRERKLMEGRVGVTPHNVRTLIAVGLQVGVEQNAGVLSGFSDAEYVSAGAVVYEKVEELYRSADIIVKVKELTLKEYHLIPLLKGKVLFTYLHLAGVDPELTKLLLTHEVTAIAYENVAVEVDGRMTLPLLAPMSKIAGVQAMRGATLHYPKDRRDREFLEVVILGGGVVGEAALNQALVEEVGLISMFESREERVRELRAKYRGELSFAIYPLSFLEDVGGRKLLKGADIVISGVKLPGDAAAPKVLNQSHFRIMKPGAYIADVAIDQGGSTAWSKVTSPGETYTRGKKGLIFSCVPNIPGSTVPAEATKELSTVTAPYVKQLGEAFLQDGASGVCWLLQEKLDLRAGLQTWRGKLFNHAAAEKHGLTDFYQTLDQVF